MIHAAGAADQPPQNDGTSSITHVGDTLQISAGKEKVVVVAGPLHVRGPVTVESESDENSKVVDLGIELGRCQADTERQEERIEMLEKQARCVRGHQVLLFCL